MKHITYIVRFITSQKAFFSLFLFLIIGAFLRLYHLDWGAPFYFHPDERNIASSITQLSFPHQVNPHFFAYGSLPIYMIYFFCLLTTGFPFHIIPVSFPSAIMASRLLSALLSLSIIPLCFRIGKHLVNENVGLITAALAMLSVGFIQFSHFGTFEMWLTFFGLLFFFLCLQTLSRTTFLRVIFLGVICGVLLSIKVTSLIFIPIGLVVLWCNKKNNFKAYGKNFLFSILFLLHVAAVFVLTNPYTFLDFPSFKNSMQYESSVSLGTLPVFYTGEFFQKIPVLFQFLHIYPFLITPLLTFLFLPAFVWVFMISIRQKKRGYLLLLVFYTVLFLSQAFLFTKWTRYIVPTLPFMYLIIAIALNEAQKKCSINRQGSHVIKVLICLIFSSALITTISYFTTVYVKPDTREGAYLWAKKHIPQNASIMSEVYDLGITPFNDTYKSIALRNIYDMDNGSPNISLAQFSYIILPSPRIYKTRILDAKQFPKAHTFYTQLFNGSLGFKKVYETPCDLLCRIAYIGDPVFTLEETASVFDRPTIYIFAKK